MIAIGCDHGGFELKGTVTKYLKDNNLEYKDFGCYAKDSCDYPEFGSAVAKAVASGECERGILICTTGIGISIAANKIRGIRCAVCSDTISAKLTREHNNANVLALGAGIVGPNLALSILDTFCIQHFHRKRNTNAELQQLRSLKRKQ